MIKLQLIRAKIYKKSHYLKNIVLEDLETRLKKALHIIFRYHMNGKRILFVGNPLKINKQIKRLLKRTSHTFIPKHAWVNGLVTNRKLSVEAVKKDTSLIRPLSKKLLRLKRKNDLVVIVDSKFERNALVESHAIRLPVIALNCDLNPANYNAVSTYKIPGDFILQQSEVENSFFYSVLRAVLLKSTKRRKLFPKEIYRTKTLLEYKKEKKPYSKQKFSSKRIPFTTLGSFSKEIPVVVLTNTTISSPAGSQPPTVPNERLLEGRNLRGGSEHKKIKGLKTTVATGISSSSNQPPLNKMPKPK